MRFVKCSLLLTCVWLVPLLAAGQVGTQTPETGVAPVYNGGALEQNNLAVGVGFEASYDDNVYSSVPAQDQGLFSFRPRVAWNISRARWNSVLDYDGWLTKTTRSDFQDRSSHAFNTSFAYQFSKRLSFTASDFFVRSADPLYWSTGFSGDNGNPSYFGPTTLRMSNGVSAQADYRLDARSDVTVGGDFFISRFSDTPKASLRDSNSAVGTAGYHRQISPHLTIGSSYDYSKITSPSSFLTISQRILATGQYAFTPNMTLSGFIGPNHVSNSFLLPYFIWLIPIHSAEWSWSGGGSFTWSTPRMTMSASGSRQVSDGGGLIGNVWLTTLGGHVQSRVSRNYTASVYGTYTLNNRLLPQTGGYLNSHYASAGVAISRSLRRDLSVRLAYDRMESQQGYYVGNPWVDRNRVTFSINYLFTHPLGR